MLQKAGLQYIRALRMMMCMGFPLQTRAIGAGSGYNSPFGGSNWGCVNCRKSQNCTDPDERIYHENG
jgi:hypothetical protein